MARRRLKRDILTRLFVTVIFVALVASFILLGYGAAGAELGAL